MNQDVKCHFVVDLTGTGDIDLSMKKYVKHSFYIVCYVDTGKEVFYTSVL